LYLVIQHFCCQSVNKFSSSTSSRPNTCERTMRTQFCCSYHIMSMWRCGMWSLYKPSVHSVKYVRLCAPSIFNDYPVFCYSRLSIALGLYKNRIIIAYAIAYTASTVCLQQY